MKPKYKEGDIVHVRLKIGKPENETGEGMWCYSVFCTDEYFPADAGSMIVLEREIVKKEEE